MSTPCCRTVGLGASAGGVEAIEAFFQHIPERPGCAFVLVMHFDPHHKPLLAELLSRHTTLPAVMAEDGMALLPNRIHIIPTNLLLTQKQGRLYLEPPAEQYGARHCIDHYFKSLAQDAGDEAIAIIFSGAGNDGALGIKEVHAQGGVTMAQDPASARFESMPLSALATGGVDVVLPPAQLAARLLTLLHQPERVDDPSLSVATTEQVLASMVARLEQCTGLAFSNYKQTTVLRRIDKRMRLRGVGTLTDYRELLCTDPEEARALAGELSVCVTSFFRDPEVFAFLEQEVLPDLFARTKENDELRLWVPGCATGEEAYSIAILLLEHMRRHGLRRKISMFATDLDDTAITKARAGVYPQNAVASLPTTLLHRHFLFQDGAYAVSAALRKLIVFAKHDLFAAPPFSRMDLISCRNLLIYLTPEAQNNLLPLFHLSLRSGGILVLGGAETLGDHGALFSAVHPKWKIFQRQNTPTPPASFPFSFRALPSELHSFRKLPDPPPPMDIPQLFQQALLARFAPPSLLVDAHDIILHMEGNLSPFLELPQGKFSGEATRLVRPPLQLPVRNALRQARRQEQPVVLSGIVLPEHPEMVVDVQVFPVQDQTCPQDCLLVAFVERPRPGSAPGDDSLELASTGCDAQNELIARLEEELRLANEQLRLTVQDLETSNEELMASNEELLSMNEELQSSNEELETSQEELQALNEELTSVNTELQANIQALDRSRSDMENLFRATDIATVFLDCNLVIRQFTPAASEIFHVMESDIGRPLRHFSSQLAGLDIQAMATAVMDRRQRLERVVHSVAKQPEERRSYLSRMFPYFNLLGDMDGLVLTFVDITERQQMVDALRRHQEQLEELVAERTRELAENKARLRTLVDHFPNGAVLLFDQDLHYLVAAGEALPELGLALDDIEGRLLSESQVPEIASTLEPLYRTALAGACSRQDLPLHGQILDTWVLPVCNEAGEIMAGMALFQVVTEQRRIQREFAETMDRFKKAFRSSPAFMLITTLAEGRIVEVNDALCIMTGFSRQELLRKSTTDLGIVPTPQERAEFVEELQTSGALAQWELRIGTKSGAVLSTVISAELIEFNGQPHILTAGMDLSERIQRERQLQAVMDHVPAAVWIAHDPACAVMEGSQAAHALLQVPPGANPSKSAPDHPPMNFRVFQGGRELETEALPMQRAAREGLPMRDVELDIVFEDGEVRHIIGNAVPLLSPDNTVSGSVGAFLDITERVQMERRLEEARALAEEANQAKTAFLANMSHELRTPLNGIMGMAQLVQICAAEPEPQQQAGMIIEASRHLQSIIDDLMDISQIESNQIKIRPFRTNVHEVLQRLMAMHQPEAERKGLALRCHIDPEVSVFIHVDGKRLSQILNNLLNNALKFTEQGRVEIAVTTQGEGEAARIRFAVQDTGIGIHASQHQAIFRTFYQVEPHLTRSSQGTGLGLSISRRLADLMGGSITLQSAPGEGSLFVLELPCQASPVEIVPTLRAPDSAALTSQQLHVLVAEDNSVSRLFMTTMLKKSGCTVDEAVDGQEAVEKVRRTAYDAVFMDIQMPRLNGLDATKHLRQDEDPRVRNTCIIALTAYAMPEDRQQFLDAGMNGFLSKPVTFQELHAALRAATSPRE